MALTALAGGVLVFRHGQPGEVDGLEIATARDAMAPLDRLYALASADDPASPPHRLLFPRVPGAPVIARVERADGVRIALHLNARTGTVEGRFVEGEDAMSWLADLHEGDWFGTVGRRIVGFGGLLAVVLVVAGGVAWCNRNGRPWAETLRPVPGLHGLRRLRNWHRVLALLAAIPLLLTALSGAALAFPRTTRLVLQTLLAAPQARIERPGKGPVTLESAVGAAHAMLPGWALVFVDVPAADARKPYFGMAMVAQSRQTVEVAAWVVVDRRDGAATAMLPGPAEHLRAWIRALHRGEIFGPVYHGAMLALALTPLALGGLGAAIWLRRRPRVTGSWLPSRSRPL